MLQHSQVLVAALSDRLFQVLERIGATSEICLVTDSPASYFVATTLLRKRANAPAVRLIDANAPQISGQKLVLFVDAVFRGDTVRRIAEGLKGQNEWSRFAVACVDMRRAPVSILLGTDCTLLGLVTYHMDPLELGPDVSPPQITEIDSTTHVPLSKPCGFTDLGTTPGREEYLRNNVGLFKVGFHRLSDGQIHTVSLDTGRLVEAHGEFVVSAVLEEVDEFLSEVRVPRSARDWVIFCRPESRVYSLLPAIADRLRREHRSVKAVFIASLAVAPLSPRPIFPREENNLLADVHVEGGQRLLFPPELRTDFVGIYIDDASITGRSLQDVIAKATCLTDRRPSALLAIVLVNRLSPREIRFLNVCHDLQAAAGPAHDMLRRAPVPFQFRSLLRLQVKMTSDGDTGHAGAVIRTLLDHADYFDDRLKSYAARISNRLSSVVGRSAIGLQTGAVVLHPFYPHDTRADHLDTRVVRLRHLLALNEQNEGVISEVLGEVTTLANQGNIELLSILALEPYLLDEEPIATQCWSALAGLCLRTIRNQGNVAHKSDAIAILAWRPSECLSHLEQILPFVLNDEDLVNQVAAFLLTFSRREPSWLTRIQKSLDAIESRVDPRTIGWLRTILDVPQRVESVYVVQDDLEAMARVRLLIAATWTHGRGLDDWQAFDTKVKNLEDNPLDTEAIQLGRRCIDFAERVLLSGLAAIRFLSSRRSRPRDADYIWNAFIEGNRRAIELRRMLTEDPGRDGLERQHFSDVWNQLRRTTIKAASAVRFLGSEEQISLEPSVIEDYLPRLFASPFPLVQGLAQRYVPDLRLAHEGSIFTEGAVLVPVQRSLVVDFFRILLENMSKYGQPEHRSSKWTLSDEGNGIVLRIEFYDQKRTGTVPGEGTGLPLLRGLARAGGFTLEPREDNDTYVSTVTFFDVLPVYPEVHGS